MSYYFGSLIDISFFIFLPLCSFFYGLFVDSNSKANLSLGITLAALAITITLSSTFFPVFMINIVNSVGIVVTLKSRRKYTSIFAWVALILSIAALFAVFAVMNSILHDYYNNLDYSYYYGMDYVSVALFLIFDIVGIAILTASTIIRIKRIRHGTLITERNVKPKLIVTGNIISITSFVFFLYGLSYLFYGLFSYYETTGFYTVALVLGVISVVLGTISWFFLRTHKDDYERTALDKLLRVWSWICLGIMVIVGLIFMAVMAIMTGMGDSNYQKPGTRTVTDEKGKKHKIDYKGGDTKEAVDESGTVWITDDGGKSFRKRDEYYYDDEQGKRHTLHDEYGTAHQSAHHFGHMRDDKGRGYEVGYWGDVEREHIWDEGEGTLGTIRESKPINADIPKDEE